jgi:hypothetical protein
MYRNKDQKWIVFAFDETTGIEEIGDAAGISAKISKDGGTSEAITDAAPVEIGSGYYAFDITAAESNAEHLTIIPVSGTTDIQVVGAPASITTFEHVICGISDGSGSTTTIVTSLETTHSLATDSALSGRIVIFDADTTTTALAQQAGTISAYNGTTGLITVNTSFTTSPASGDTFKIY